MISRRDFFPIFGGLSATNYLLTAGPSTAQEAYPFPSDLAVAKAGDVLLYSRGVRIFPNVDGVYEATLSEPLFVYCIVGLNLEYPAMQGCLVFTSTRLMLEKQGDRATNVELLKGPLEAPNLADASSENENVKLIVKYEAFKTWHLGNKIEVSPKARDVIYEFHTDLLVRSNQDSELITSGTQEYPDKFIFDERFDYDERMIVRQAQIIRFLHRRHPKLIVGRNITGDLVGLAARPILLNTGRFQKATRVYFRITSINCEFPEAKLELKNVDI